jgi:hypothetical protein
MQIQHHRAVQDPTLDRSGQRRAERPVRGRDLQAADGDRALTVKCSGDPRLER